MKKLFLSILIAVSLSSFGQPKSSKQSQPSKTEDAPVLIGDTIKVFIGTLDQEGYLKYTKGFIIRKMFAYGGQVISIKEAILYDEKFNKVNNAFDTKQRQ